MRRHLRFNRRRMCKWSTSKPKSVLMRVFRGVCDSKHVAAIIISTRILHISCSTSRGSLWGQDQPRTIRLLGEARQRAMWTIQKFGQNTCRSIAMGNQLTRPAAQAQILIHRHKIYARGTWSRTLLCSQKFKHCQTMFSAHSQTTVLKNSRRLRNQHRPSALGLDLRSIKL